MIVILFRFICETVEEYIAPAIVYLSEYLKLSDALAGVTLLAFSNGAGDVITAIVASDSKEGVSYNVGALYGAGLFVISLIISLTIKNSPNPIVVEPAVIWRDIGFYILAALFTLFFAYQGKITIISSVLMLGLYVVYVIVVLIQDSMQKDDDNQDESKTEQLVTELDDNQENHLKKSETLNKKTSKSKIVRKRSL